MDSMFYKLLDLFLNVSGHADTKIHSARSTLPRRTPKVIEINFSDYSESSDVPTIPTVGAAKVSLDTDSESYYYVSDEEVNSTAKPKAPPEPRTPSPRKSSAHASPSPKKAEDESETLSNCFTLPQEYIPMSEIIPHEEPTSFTVIAQRSGKDVAMSAYEEENQTLVSSKEVNGREKFYAIRDTAGALVGFVRKWNRGHGYSVCSANKRERDDRDGELMGVGFQNHKMRVVVTRDGNESWAVSKRRLLSSIAQTDAETNEKLIIGDMDLVSMKLVDQGTETPVFSMTKNENDSYFVERSGYITKLEAYALAYLIVKKKLM